MFATEDVCQRSLEALLAEGFGKTLPGMLRALVEAGFLSRQRGYGACPGHLPAPAAAGAAMRRRRREKVFGPGRAVPLDRNAKARILAYARAWGARHRQPGQHKGPITRAFLDVLEALLWGFHNARSGCCFPSYETIADKAECARSTVAEALKALEWAGVLTWQNRITRIRERCRDLFGRWAGAGGSSAPPTPTCSATRKQRNPAAFLLPSPKIRPGTLNQEILNPSTGTSSRPGQPAGARLASSAAPSKEDCSRTRSGGTVPAT